MISIRWCCIHRLNSRRFNDKSLVRKKWFEFPIQGGALLNKEDNEFACRVGPGTPMGELFRRFWLPAMLPSELPKPDCPPVRLRLLGEDLVAVRGLGVEVAHHRGRTAVAVPGDAGERSRGLARFQVVRIVRSGPAHVAAVKPRMDEPSKVRLS